MTSHRRSGISSKKPDSGVWVAIALLLMCFLGLAGFELWRLGVVPSPLASYHSLSNSVLQGHNGARRSGASRRQLDIGINQSARHFPASHLRSLVLVACHSVYTGLDFSHPEDQSSWLLLDYQKVPGQTHSFVQHIQLGINKAADTPDAMLLFSGGKTRQDAGPRAESMGYWLVSEANGWFGKKDSVRARAFTEEHARDSYENLLFGLCRFYELTGHYPDSLVVVGYEFKRERFAELHRSALHWPAHTFEYVGTPALTEAAAEGEAKTAAAFEADPYGCSGELAAKRATRDPFADGGYSGDRCPALSRLLTHCGPEAYEGRLPWE